MTIYQNCSNCSAPLNKMAATPKKRKTFKQLLNLNQCIDFEIILQEGFLGDPLSELLKPFRSVKQDGPRAKIEKPLTTSSPEPEDGF